MAAKKNGKGDLALSSAAALQHADVAFGLKYLKSGFGFDETEDIARPMCNDMEHSREVLEHLACA